MTSETTLVHVGLLRALNIQKGPYLSWVSILTLCYITTNFYVDAACDAKYQTISGHSACLSQASNYVSGGVTAAQKTEIVDLHNELRANVTPTATNMLKMSWDDDLATVAQTYAEHCVYAHDGNFQRMIPGRYGAGQNLAVSSGSTTWSSMIHLWDDEKYNFTYGSGPIGGAVVGHYTQLVWAKSHKIGCGYALCTNLAVGGGSYPNGHYYVCNYAPGGNDLSSQYEPYINGTSCGDCQNTCDSTHNALCDCTANDCYNDGTFNVNTCSCSCKGGYSFYSGDSCVLNCSAISSVPSWCSSYDITHCSLYSNIPFDCPDDNTCNLCPEADSTHLLASSDACASTPCLHSGQCTNTASGYTCNCTGTGYEGTTCQTDINECNTGTPCLNGGVCSNTAGSFTCNCSGTGYQGDTCQNDINECNTGTPCLNSGVCSNTAGSFTCNCTGTGYQGDTCQNDINECNTGTPCLNGGVCSNTAGSFTCNCTGTGYQGDTCQNEINECNTGTPCLNGGVCSNTAGSFTCNCTGTGYQGDTCQNDINECNTGTPCLNGGVCSNTAGSFTCNCTGTGYQGDTCQNDINECNTGTPCLNGGVCSNTLGSFTCNCSGTGYQGATCQNDINECNTGTPCLNGGVCSNTAGSFTCNCTGTGYQGDTCQNDINECNTGTPCSNGGICSNTIGSFTCNCTGTGFGGATCTDTITGACASGPCQNNGTCTNTASGYTCNCTGTGYEGATCQTEINECNTGTPCLNGGVCSNTAGSFTCNCSGTGYQGDTCQNDINECNTGTPCLNGGVCSNTAGSFTCNCTGTGYQGDTCQNDVNECNTGTPCSNGGICSNTIGSFTCNCTGTGFGGATCTDTPGSAVIQQGQCNANTGTITLNVTGAQGYFIYVSGCASTDGTYGGSGVPSANEQVTITGCNPQWNTNVTLIVTSRAGVITGSDLANARTLLCTPSTGAVNVTSSLTAGPGAASSVNVHTIKTKVMMMFTVNGAGKTGTPVSSAGLGDHLQLHIWIDDLHVGAFSIRVKTVTLDVSGLPSIVLTGNDGMGTTDGCKAKAYWVDLNSISPGYVRSDPFETFILAGSSGVNQLYSAVVEICNSTGCISYTCPATIRKRRDLTSDASEEVEITNQLRILPSTDVPVASTDQQIWNEPEPIVSHDPNCEVCLDKGVLAGVAVFVVFVIVLTNAASVYLYLRGRGRFVKGGAVGPGKEKNKEAM